MAEVTTEDVRELVSVAARTAIKLGKTINVDGVLGDFDRWLRNVKDAEWEEGYSRGYDDALGVI